MLENKVQEFLKQELRDWDDSFEYTLEKVDDIIVVDFTKIFSQKAYKEIHFHLIDNVLHMTNLSEGYQELIGLEHSKFFWITLLCDV